MIYPEAATPSSRFLLSVLLQDPYGYVHWRCYHADTLHGVERIARRERDKLADGWRLTGAFLSENAVALPVHLP